MTVNPIQISIHGKWSTVPAMEINGSVIARTGRWLKVAVVHDEEYQEEELRDPPSCVATLRDRERCPLGADILTFTQKLPASEPRFPYPFEWESVAVVRTSNYKAWWEGLPQESRKNVRRAAKRGVRLEVRQLDDALLKDIQTLNNDSPVRQGRAFVHYGKTLDEVAFDQAAFRGRSDYVCAYFEDELVGFMKIVYRGDVASMVQILPKARHADKRPANALIARAVELCHDKGLSYLTYGLFNYGNRRESSLRLFKTRNGFEEMRVPRYYVPLTPWGRVATALKIHRGLIGILPEPVIRIGAGARARLSAWAVNRGPA
jgi:hypothetical protein